MTLIVEDGTGIFEANAYAGRGFVRNYLQMRNRLTDWNTADDAEKDASIIAATDYIDRRFGQRFRGFKQFRNMTVANWNILQIRTNPEAGDTLTIGERTYTFVADATEPYEITIGDTLIVSSQRLLEAVNGVGATPINPQASAAATDSPGDLIIRALVGGNVPTTSSTVRMVFDTDILTGGYASVEQFLEFPRIHLYTNTGGHISGVPEKLKQAVAEYASRALTEILMPDPVTSSRAGELTHYTRMVGPIKIEKRFAPGTMDEIFKKFPTADRLVREFVRPPGEVYR